MRTGIINILDSSCDKAVGPSLEPCPLVGHVWGLFYE